MGTTALEYVGGDLHLEEEAGGDAGGDKVVVVVVVEVVFSTPSTSPPPRLVLVVLAIAWFLVGDFFRGTEATPSLFPLFFGGT